MGQETELTPRITELVEEANAAPDLPTSSSALDTGFTFPSQGALEAGDGVNAWEEKEGKRKRNSNERFDSKNTKAREGSPADGLVSEQGMPGLLALPNVGEERTEEAMGPESDQRGALGERIHIRSHDSTRQSSSHDSLVLRLS
jgi:hypothetical protein